ncbi:aldehyde dehydrogenase family protein, partial [Thioclava sp. BHET1]
TRQLIAGGRDPDLRQRETVQALESLAERGWVPPETAQSLIQDYRAHREVEHRLQMIRDAQTHDLPQTAEGFDRLARFMGEGDTERLRQRLTERLSRVEGMTEGFFAPEAPAETALPALSESAQTILRRWPNYPALRSSRAVEIFQRLRPVILNRLSRAAQPDQALTRFDGFLAGLPAGVFNLVNGDGAGVGSQLSSHPDVEMISFTGSTRAGIAISKAAADTLKKVALELGGKGANLVFADADEKAVRRGVQHCFNNSGQSCNAPSRMLVERAIYDQAVEIARSVAEETRVAPASEAGKHIGPVVSEVQYTKIQELIAAGIDEGARLVAGGLGRPEGLNRGYFVRPTVFADVVPG